MTYVLGVDGGGSKTVAAVADETGAILGVGRAGCGNHQICGIAQAVDAVQTAVNGALSAAGVDADAVAMTVFGLAGADRESDEVLLKPALETLPVQPWRLVCDTLTGLRTGSANHVGVVLVCGSGTNAMGRNPRGDVLQVGGFGWLYGDATGGTHLAAETFRRTIRSYEGRDMPSLLTESVPHHLGFDSMTAMLSDYLDRNVQSVPLSLVEVLHSTADQGDTLAVSVLSEAGRELGAAAAAVLRRLGGWGSDPVPVVLTGSILQKGRNPHLRKALEDIVRAECPNAQLVVPDLPPVYGALLLAMDELGLPVTAAVLDTFERNRGRLE